MPLLSSIDVFAPNLHKCKQEGSQVLAAHFCGCMNKFGLAHKSLSSLVTPMLTEVGSVFDAHMTLDKMTSYNGFSWNSLIVEYVKCGKFQQALFLYQEVQAVPLHPNEYVLAALLKSCAELMEVQRGYEIHNEIIIVGLLDCDVFVGNTLTDMYVKFGFLAEARVVFDALPVHDVVSWNILIRGYVKHENGEEVLSLFKLMLLEGTSPNVVTFLSSLKGCSIAGAMYKGQEIHEEAARAGLLHSDIAVGNALVDMYSSCGSLARAREVFDKLVVPDVISWNTLLSGYAKHEYAVDVLQCFEQMQLEGVFPDAVTLVSVLKASGILGATYEGRKSHLWIANKGLLERDIVLGNALLGMYATCGFLENAKQVFSKLVNRTVVSWTALMAGYVEHDHSSDAFLCFEQMQLEGLSPNAATLSCVLSACSRLGLIEDAQKHFLNMRTSYAIEPDLEQYTCMVDAFGRAGHLDIAVGIIEKMQFSDSGVWSALLSSCRKWGDPNVARWAFKHAVQVDKSDAAIYVFTADIYAAGYLQEDTKKLKPR